MAIVKIHPIKGTLEKAVDYISDESKTEKYAYISTGNCEMEHLAEQFLFLRKENNTKGSVLARHLVQSFSPGELSPKKAHDIGLNLCKNILKDEYQYIITTHVDKEHIHNHIIFNNVNMVSGKCYQSNKKTYHHIRYQSDKLCKENNISIVDKYYKKYVTKYKNKGFSYFEFLKEKKGIVWKSKLQKDIDIAIGKSNSFEEFLKIMKEKYDIKRGKHIAFKDLSKKANQKYTRARVIGEGYTEEKIIDRILNKDKYTEILANTTNIDKKEDYVINIKDNKKVRESKGYEYFAKKHNLKVGAKTIVELRKLDIKTKEDLNRIIRENISKKLELQAKMKELETENKDLKRLIEDVNTVQKYKNIYDTYNKNKDKFFYEEYRKEIEFYKNAEVNLKEKYENLTIIPKTKDIVERLESIEKEKETLYEEYYKNKEELANLMKLKKNYEAYKEEKIDKEKQVER